MSETGDKPTREERLAEQLRKNLRRRKEQARTITRESSGDDGKTNVT